MKLICTVTHKNNIDVITNLLKTEYQGIIKKAFVFSNNEYQNEIYITYTLPKDCRMILNSFIIHRKSETNTLYTINALNHIIKKINNGVLDKSMQLVWENYPNMIILFKQNKLRKIKLNLIKILNF